MLRHAIAPAHSFAQIPNVILRHPRLSSDAKNLLNWQLSLPSDEKQCLSETAAKAGIRKCAFQKAKRQLLDEGFLHEWTVRKDGGRFATVQLIANTALSAKEALAVRDGLRPTPGGARLTAGAEERKRPSAAEPAAGEPTGPSVGRQPQENTRENTSQPTGSVHESAAEVPGGLAAAEALLLSVAKLDPQFAMSARTARRWAPLMAKWLDSGLSPLRIRHTLTEGLESARKPLGALRWRLEHALPEVPPPPAPSPAEPAAPAPEVRVSGMRECEGSHTYPRLFTPPPGSDEKLCSACHATEPPPPPLEVGSGFTRYAAARQECRRRRLTA